VFSPFSVCCFCKSPRKQFINSGNFGTEGRKNGRNMEDKGWEKIRT
jgi:hypothetical protein